LKGGYCEREQLSRNAPNLPFPSVRFFHVRSEQAPGFEENVDSGFGERNAVVTRPTHKVRPMLLCVTDESG
jgi:hypothetical protein